ncbi:MAG: DUF6527 family protein [Sagittula sp.]|uniref:DUF6527 family protein n=1 Tax=Sagittula sp. TaxID=2038081 RepID=UPI0022F0F09E|nr:DUF6527 family protein [Paracoccus sp. SCSIO 75233]WBU54954.1 DUF6527 family protein [Paracoccus sp. SCSIO 75233]
MIRDILRTCLVTLRLVDRPAVLLRYLEQQPSPEEIAPGDVILVGDRDKLKWAVMACPGGCGNIMRLPLVSNRRPHWSVNRDWLGRPSLSPSVHQRNACRAHFWIRKGAVTWCRNSGCGHP